MATFGTGPGLHVINLSDPTPVSTTTVLMPWTQLLLFPGTALLFVVNLDVANAVTVTMDTSQLPPYPDSDKASQLDIAGKPRVT